MDLHTDPGQLVAIRADASEATAVSRTIVGLDAPLAGQVLIGRRNVTPVPPGHRQVGYVPAGDSLLPGLNVRRNVWYGVPEAARADQVNRDLVDRLVAALGIGPSLHFRPHELEDGERFHVAMARAMACNHEVLVVDLPRPVPGALGPREILDRCRREIEPMVIVTMVVCTADPGLLATVDRVVDPTPVLPPPDGASPGRAGP